ncbi:MAG TPA: GNAT family N-acetyltransferase [Actinomycetota bacterium]|nr:GNAT family N-acetyltransferase [Actinomycetota bacterium]
MIEIRPAAPGDAKTLTALAIRSKAHWGYDKTFMQACRPSLAIHATCVQPTFVAEVDGATAGFYQLEGSEIGAFFVDPPFIGRGVGRALWEHLMQEAQRRGLAAVEILSDPNAEGFYRTMGAERAGEAPSDVFGPERMLPLMRAAIRR